MPGSASRTTDHCDRPSALAPAGAADTHAGGVGDRPLDLSGPARSRAMTRVGSVRPLGKCADSVSIAADRFGLHPELLGLRQADRCAQQAGAQQRQGRRSRPPRPRRAAVPPPSATRCHDTAVGKGSALPACGTNGQNSRLPNRASSGGSTSSTNTAATTRPVAACTPRLRVLGDDANSSVSRASTTVALLARIGGSRPAHRGARWRRGGSSLRPQLLAVAGDQQQRIVGARPEHQHAGDARRRPVGGQSESTAATAAPTTAATRSANPITASGTSHSTGER